MGILFISTNDWVPWGGSEVLWSKTALAIANLKNRQIAVYVKKWEPTPNHILDLENAGVKIIYKDKNIGLVKRILKRIAPWLSNFTQHDLKVFDPTAWRLIVFSLGDHNQESGIIEACRKANIPYVLVVQLAKTATIPPDGDLAQRIKKNYVSAKKIYFVSNQNRKIVETQLASSLDNAEVVSNPFPRSNVESKYPSSDNKFSLAFVASLSSNHKGHDLLFEVLSDEKWRARNLFVNLYGQGPHAKYINDLKQYYNLQKVTIVGFSSDLEKIWQENHGLILCSRMEGQSLALLEAMSHNRMAIVTDVGDASVLIEDGVDGFFADAPTVKHIDEALERAWAKKHLWEEMGKRAGHKLRQLRSEDPIAAFAQKILQDAGE